ncbi:unnamed protein product, partial [marine sediment metagenome]
MGWYLKAVIATAVTVSVTVSTAFGADGDRARVLLVTGVDHPAHDWQLTTPVIRDILTRERQFSVQVVEQPELLATDMIFDYDVIFLHFRNAKPL